MFKFGLNRVAAIVVRASYLVGLFLAVFLFFQHAGLDTSVYGYVLSVAMAGAVLLHEFLQQQTVLSLFRQAIRNPEDTKKGALAFHTTALVLLMGFDLFCALHLTSAGWVLPLLFFLSTILVEAEEDASGILSRNAMVMLLKTSRTTTSQWRRRVRAAKKRGTNLAPVMATLMEDAGNSADAKRVRQIDAVLTAAEGGAAPRRQGNSRQLYVSPAQAASGPAPIQFLSSASGEIPDQNPRTRKPRASVKKTARERVWSVLDRAESPTEMTVAEVARLAKCDGKTAGKYRNDWLAAHSIQLQA